jgi:hypothetical protein
MLDEFVNVQVVPVLSQIVDATEVSTVHVAAVVLIVPVVPQVRAIEPAVMFLPLPSNDPAVRVSAASLRIVKAS